MNLLDVTKWIFFISFIQIECTYLTTLANLKITPSSAEDEKKLWCIVRYEYDGQRI